MGNLAQTKAPVPRQRQRINSIQKNLT